MLVVDDEASVRMLVKEVLEELGYSVVEASDGASGLKILESGRRLAHPDLKILFITGYAENAVIGKGDLDLPRPRRHGDPTAAAIEGRILDRLLRR